MSRKTIHLWKKTAETYGMEALRPNDRRPAQMPNATPGWVIDKLLVLAVLHPTRGARFYADRLGDGGYDIGTILSDNGGEFTRRRSISRHQLQIEANAWLGDYNTIRPNHGSWMAGRSPKQLLNNQQ